MLTIRDILQQEQTNRAYIYLYRRGLFYEAFNYSAYLLCHLVYPFEVTSLRNKRINKRYFMVSFPVHLLLGYSGKATCDRLADGQVLRYTPSKRAKATLPESYVEWCLRYTPVRGKGATTTPSTPSTTSPTTPSTTPSPTTPTATSPTTSPTTPSTSPTQDEEPASSPKAPAVNRSQDMGVCSNLSKLLQDLEHESEQESLFLTAKRVSYELTLDDKASLCDWLVYRILKLPTQRLCPMEALDQLDKLQQELRQKLS